MVSIFSMSRQDSSFLILYNWLSYRGQNNCFARNNIANPTRAYKAEIPWSKFALWAQVFFFFTYNSTFMWNFIWLNGEPLIDTISFLALVEVQLDLEQLQLRLWVCGSGFGSVAPVTALWLWLRLCGSGFGSVAPALALWLQLRLCGSSFDSVAPALALWLRLWLCGSGFGSVAPVTALWNKLWLCSSG